MSQGARQWANFLLFSRSFTLGNLGAMKDAVTGLPRDVQAQIIRDSGELMNQTATSMAKRKAIGVIAADIALMYVGNAALQSAIAVMSGQSTGQQEADGYMRRLQKLATRTKESPLDVLNPFNIPDNIASLMPQGENEPGKQDRVKVGHSPDGTAIYMRNPTGKIGEEFIGWRYPRDMITRKMGTIARPLYQVLANDAGFGHQLYDPYTKTTSGEIANIGNIVSAFMGDQVPLASIKAARDMLAGRGDQKLEAAQVAGPLLGLTFSRGYPGGEAGAVVNRTRQEHNFQVQQGLPAVRRDIQDGKIDAATEKMTKLGMSTGTQRRIMFTTMHPDQALSRRQIDEFQRTASPEEKEEYERLKEGAQ